MTTLGQQVRTIVSNLPRQDKLFFGGPPHGSEIDREIKNYNTYLESGLPSRQRVCLGICAFDQNGQVIGYTSSTIMTNANPTKYERESIKSTTPLNYIQGKKIVVAQAYWRKGVAEKLFKESLGLAKTHNKKWVTDINAKNIAVLKFLEKHDIQKQFSWNTLRGTEMYRVGN
ncbi:GNAT family N-acetyltransferase [archaeon]|jgi:GNAT superfamily N-acetyltransferase|nr:GNAT family N-acetyltransferase [archaeon]MBT7128767.1 GNAT family N-acetyltransferase [archaeon]